MQKVLDRKRRDSNMELYRIVCMLTVVFFHIFGVVDISNAKLPSGQCSIGVLPTQLLTSATFVCIDVFVLLSGWYGIKPRAEKVISFVFQVLFYSVISYVLFLIFCADVTFSPSFLIHIFLLDDYWFVPVYLLLYLVAPVFNPFISNSSHQQFKRVLIILILFQSIYGWMDTREAGWLEGRSPVSFFLLYLLGGYVRRFPVRLKQQSVKVLMMLYAVAVNINALVAFAAKSSGNQSMTDQVYNFGSPIIIFASLCLLLIFSKLNLGYNRTINFVARSSFAVFLIHCFPLFIQKLFWPFFEHLYATTSATLFLTLSIIIGISFFMAAVAIDQLRILIYNLLRRYLSHE
ncbi:MAG: acyltransferase [Prevotella sp.]|nr:acyltransferase [Prevotella sp.]